MAGEAYNKRMIKKVFLEVAAAGHGHAGLGDTVELESLRETRFKVSCKSLGFWRRRRCRKIFSIHDDDFLTSQRDAFFGRLSHLSCPGRQLTSRFQRIEQGKKGKPGDLTTPNSVYKEHA